jgi:hypothetical protein
MFILRSAIFIFGMKIERTHELRLWLVEIVIFGASELIAGAKWHRHLGDLLISHGRGIRGVLNVEITF